MDVLVSRDGPLVTLTLNRPEHENRLTQDVLVRLASELRRASDDDSVSAIAITGVGDWFCGGAQMPVADEKAVTEALLDFGNAWLGVRDAVGELGKPVIAAVNGRAFAGGLALTALADLAFAVPGATFGLPELQYGIFPMLVLAVVIDELPRKIAFDLIYRGRVINSEEALRLDLINDVVETDALRPTLRATADRLASANPVALRIGRQAYHAMDGMTAHERMVFARHVAANLLRTDVASSAYRRRLERIEK